MHRTLTVSLALIFSTLQLTAGWIRIYGRHGRGCGELGYGVAESPDGGYMAIGQTGEYGAYTWLLKTDSLGDTTWTRAFAWDRRNECYCIHAVPEGGYILAGLIRCESTQGGQQLLLVRTDSAGDTLWTRTYGGKESDWAYWVCKTSDGGYAATGIGDWKGSELPRKLFLVRTDSAGDTLWTKKYGGDKDDYGTCVAETPDGGFIITGYTHSFTQYDDTDMWFLKTDSLGDTLWTRTFGGENIDGGNHMIVAQDGGYVIAGIYDLTGSMVPMSGDLWLLKIDSAGNLEWEKTYGITGGGFVESAYSVEQTADGGYIVSGSRVTLGPTGTDLWLLKTDSQGDTLWTRSFGWAAAEYGRCVHQTADGGYIVCGHTNSFGESASDNDVLLIKTDSLGLLNIEESSSVFLPPSWDIASPVTSVGGSVVLRYENYPQGFKASIYDATGRKVDSIQSSSPSGTITWPVTPVTPVTHPLPPGVYIIREEGGTRAKVVLVK